MSVEIHPYFDERGWRRAGAPAGFEALGDFLEGDVQSSVDYCQDLLSVLGSIEQGALQNYEGSGNAFTLTLTQQGALLQCLWVEHLSCELSHADLRAALHAWQQFIASRKPGDF